MRRFYAVSRQDQGKLEEAFPHILEVAHGEASGYGRVGISVFDHWLSEGEAEAAFHDVAREEQARRDAAHHSFTRRLVSGSGVLTFRLRGRGRKERVAFKRFASVDVAVEYVRPKGRPSVVLVLPEIGGVYYEGWDYTNVLYFRSGAVLEPFIALAKECGLFALPCGT